MTLLKILPLQNTLLMMGIVNSKRYVAEYLTVKILYKMLSAMITNLSKMSKSIFLLHVYMDIGIRR